MNLKTEYTGDYVRPCQTFALDSAREQVNGSAIIVLPCGAGKTYTGVAQMCQDVQEAIDNNPTSVNDTKHTIDFLIIAPMKAIIDRWVEELCRCTTISKKSLMIIDDGQREPSLRSDVPGPVRVFLITYSLIRTKVATHGMVVDQLRKILYRRVICDECHHVPGENTYLALRNMKIKHPSMKWTGLTASPINSADKDCKRMIGLMGPQVDGGMSWKMMQQQQYIAPLSLTNVLCPLPKLWKEMYDELLHNKTAKDRSALMRRLEMFNPNKLAFIDRLAQKALDEGHKFILFCDCVQLLREMARVMEFDYIDGSTDEKVRKRFYAELRDGTRRMLLVSRIADTGIDFPDVDWAGQIDALGGSQRQKTQRVGRVLRFEENKNAAFWDVVTTHYDHETHEERFLMERDVFLSQQDYKIECDVQGGAAPTATRFLEPDQQILLLNLVKAYPNVKRECIKIHDEYKKDLKEIIAKRPARSTVIEWTGFGSRPRSTILDKRKRGNYKSRRKEFEEKLRILRGRRDEKLKGINALIYADESEFDDASIDEGEENEEDEGEEDGEDEGEDDGKNTGEDDGEEDNSNVNSKKSKTAEANYERVGCAMDSDEDR